MMPRRRLPGDVGREFSRQDAAPQGAAPQALSESA